MITESTYLTDNIYVNIPSNLYFYLFCLLTTSRSFIWYHFSDDIELHKRNICISLIKQIICTMYAKFMVNGKFDRNLTEYDRQVCLN